MTLDVVDLGRMAYGAALDAQRARLEQVAAGRARPAIFLVEHDPVVTVSRRPAAAGHVRASPAELRAQGVALASTDRGGDVTYHGPGQLVVYPVVRLGETGRTLTGYVRALEEAVIAALGGFGVVGWAEAGAAGVWVQAPGGAAKVCAVGVRLRRGVTLHGLALNVAPDLSHFELINPCGLGRPVTSLRALQGDARPSMETVKGAVVDALQRVLEPGAVATERSGC